MTYQGKVPNPVRETSSLPYGISSIAKAQLYLVNVVVDVRVGAGVEKREKTYLAAFQEDGMQVLLLHPYLEEGAAWRPADPKMRADFLRKLRVGELPEVQPQTPPGKIQMSTLDAPLKYGSTLDAPTKYVATDAPKLAEESFPRHLRKGVRARARKTEVTPEQDEISAGDEIGAVDDLPPVK